MDYKIAAAVIIGVLLAGALSDLIWLKSAFQTSIFLYPREIGAIVGENFAVFIRVSDVSDLFVAPPVGLEPTTHGLTARCSTN